MKLQITLQSFLLTGSGEGSALIDTDIVFDKDGFPFIPARRIKGMLKESMTEVMEMKGEPECKIEEDVIKFFGKEGDEKNSGRLLFKNYYLSEVSKENLPDLKKKHPFAFAPENIRKFFTAEIHQTALQDEVAKDTSLRNYRVIKPFIANGKAICFEGVINGNETLAENEKALLKEAVLNFRYAGTRRNRGFGKVSCRLDNSSSNDTNFSKAALGSNNAVIESGDASTLQVTNNEVFVQIKTLSPVVLAMQLGEKNTVLTEKVFNGNRLRGLLASQYIQARNLANAHSDPAFKELFLTCEVCFEPLFYNNAKPLPLHIHSYKSKNTKLTENEVNNEELVNIFNKPTEDEYEITKTVGGTFIRQQNTFTAQKPDTTFFFHNSRPNRSAGRSEEDQDTGGIFYYEALDEGQTFAGCIKGPAKFLNELIKEVSKQKTAQAGRSRSAQYGEVEITFTASPVSEAVEPDKNFTITHDIQPASEQQFLLTLQSPLLLLNKYGEPEANKNTLLHYVNTALNTSDITVENAAAAFTIVEQYNSVWKSKSGKLPAYKEGSAFLLNILSSSVNQKLLETVTTKGLGELTEQGFGKILIAPYSSVQKLIKTEPKKLHITNDEKTGMPEPTADKNFSEHILYNYQQNTKESDTKTNAINDANLNEKESRYLKLSNNLISSLEMVIKTMDANGIKNWLQATKGKPAGDALRKAGLVDHDHNFEFTEEKNKIYWLTFFRTLRILKRIKETINE